MLFTIASFFLSAILLTQANIIDEDVINSKPLSEEVFIFDVTSDATAAELKGSLESAGVEIRHSFQVLGTRQYLFVVLGDLSKLNFPEGSVVTQYPAQHIGDFYKLVGASGWDGNVTEVALDDKNLGVVVWDVIPAPGSSTALLNQRIRDSASLNRGGAEKVKPAQYAAVGRYPPKMFFFMNLIENAMQSALLDMQDAAGGPSNNVISYLRLRKI